MGCIAALEKETTVINQVHGQLQAGNLKGSRHGPQPAGETMVLNADLS